MLLRQARELAQQGVKRFIVASNDHQFARIAAFADLHVVPLTNDYVSTRLRQSAQAVTVLTLSEGGWDSRTPDRVSWFMHGRGGL